MCEYKEGESFKKVTVVTCKHRAVRNLVYRVLLEWYPMHNWGKRLRIVKFFF